MAQYYTITVDDIGDFTPGGAVPQRAIVRTNLEPGAVVVDTSANRLHLGASRFDFTDGTRSLAMELLSTNATDLNIEPGTLQYWLDLDYAEPAHNGRPSRQATVSIGPFPVTADGPLAALASHFDTPAVTPTWRDAFIEQVEGIAGGAQQAMYDMASLLGGLSGVANPGALVPWRTALAGAASGSDVANLVVIGDSIAEGAVAPAYHASWPMLAQDALRTLVGRTGGIGYVPATSTTGAVVPAIPATVVGTYDGWRYGLGGRAVFLTAPGDHATYASQQTTQVRVRYSKIDVAAGGLKVFIDDVETVTLSSNPGVGGQPSGGHVWTSGPLTPGPHTVRVEPSVPGWVGVLEGVDFIDGDEAAGVRVYNAGHYGGQASDFVGPMMGPSWQSVAAAQPDLVIIMLGANDITFSSVSAFLASIDQMISKVPAGVPVMLMGCYLIGQYGDDPAMIAKWQQMQTGLRAKATGRVAYLDLAPHWPKLLPDGSTNSGLMFESTNASHPNGAGHALIAQVVTAALGPDLVAPFRGRDGLDGDMTPAVTETWSGAVSLPASTLPSTRRVTMTGNVTLALPTPDGAVSGTITLMLHQDATGGRTLSVPGAVTAYGVAPTLSGAPNAVDLVHCFWSGEAWTVLVGASHLSIPTGWVV